VVPDVAHEEKNPVAISAAKTAIAEKIYLFAFFFIV
jgi:hypothetical protein